MLHNEEFFNIKIVEVEMEFMSFELMGVKLKKFFFKKI